MAQSIVFRYLSVCRSSHTYKFLLHTWIIAETFREEHKLVRNFGDEYKKYQQAVPMLIPLS